MRQAGHNDPENKKMFGQYAMGLEFAEWTGMRWRAPNMDSVDVEDLEWVIVRGCVGIPDFAFEPCDVEELVDHLRSWRRVSGLGVASVTYGLFTHKDGFCMTPLYERFSISDLKAYDDVKTDEDLYNAICASEEAEEMGLVAII